MFLILDLILVGIFALIVFLAVKKGFLRTVLDVVAVIVACALAWALSTPVAQSCYDGFVEDIIIESVKDEIDKSNFDATVAAEEVVEAFKELPPFVVDLADAVGVDFDKLIKEADFEDVDANDSVTQLVRKIAEPIAVKIMSAVIFLILAIILMIILKIVVAVICKVTVLPIIGEADKLLGGILGGVKGFLLVGVIAIILQALFGKDTGVMGEMVDDSFVIGLLNMF